MITDAELSALIAEAGAAIPEPSGAEAILAAARAESSSASVTSPITRLGTPTRGFALKALGAAAALAIVIALVVNSLSSPPNVVHQASAEPPTILGTNAEPGDFASALPRSANGSSGSAAAKTSSATGGATSSSQKIITTGTLSLVVDKSELRHVVGELQTIATAFGGYVSTSNVSLAGASRGGTVVLAIPASYFQKAVGEAEALGAVKHLSTTANDVTGQVADLGAQLAALEAARTQLEALFSRAGSIPALLSVQNEITSVQSQIQQLQAQQRVLANEISFSDLTVAIAPPRPPVVSPPSGFSKAWHAAVRHFENGLSSLLADSGIVLFTILLVAVIGLLVVLLGRLLWSFVRRRLL